MKKACMFLILAIAIAVVGSLTACEMKERGDGIQIVTTIFPEYDWMREVIGDSQGVELTLLLDSGVDLHSYQATVDDIITISECDIFVYVGGESEKWVEDALKNANNPDMVVIDLMEVLGDAVKTEEVVEGMQGEDEQDTDEHVWLSVKNAIVICREFADKLSKVDAENKGNYGKNANAYIERLTVLDEQYQNAVDNASIKTILFGDRFPFRYLADDYGLDYYAAFVGCSAETEASFDTIAFLSAKVDELGLPAVLTIENSDQKIAHTIVNYTRDKNQRILTMDSLQSTTARDMANGITFLSVMESNLRVLIQALTPMDD
ncbi:MAG: metal ABC transporter substrate-binding protein [Clostridia bacterium]|nr:metal ABC transporter substrate-binding protein [Clostridia bacterium]